MNRLLKFTSALALSLFASASASHLDAFFINTGNEKTACISTMPTGGFGFCIEAQGKLSFTARDADVRIRIIGGIDDDAAILKKALSRPFLIIDGIHLSVDEERTLDQLQEETEQFGIPKILTELGYTPILVQFSQTVHTSLQKNSQTFAALLKFLGNNKAISFPNKKEDGFIVLGISQGGIIGRYGSYLYDTSRKAGDTPIRLYASLDSPHQGAVMPRGLISTIDFWANKAGVASAEAFNDLITSPGARDLLLYDTEAGNGTYEAKTDAGRFLFGEYRKAANYKGFPAILIAQGQLKGKSPKHATTYFALNRSAKRGSEPWGRASSRMMASESKDSAFSHNHVYEFLSQDETSTPKGNAKFDFVQGSTYPFARTMYTSLREGMEDAIPDDMKYDIKLFGATLYTLNFKNSWEADTLYQGSSTFIPTASAMDLQCNGDLAMRSDCAFSKSYSGFPFENPGKNSTAKAVYAVDATHPRFEEATSGRHIEPAVRSDGSIDRAVLEGMQADVWRLLCEVAKADYDSANHEFRNMKLTGMFQPHTSCMDASKMPEIIKNAGALQTKKFGFIRYDYNDKATESDDEVKFTLPSGWQKVATVDNANDVPEGSVFEIGIKAENSKGNWMKAEILLTKRKDGGAQVQLEEVNVPQDGQFHTLRWQMPSVPGAMSNYRWFRLVLNSNGATMTLTKPRLITSTVANLEKPSPIATRTLFPSNYGIVKWSPTTSITYNDKAAAFSFAERYSGIHLDFGGTYSLDAYSELKVEYRAGTCLHSEIYFGNASKGKVNLGSNNSLQNEFVSKILPLSQIVNTSVTASNGYSASRLTLQAMRANETCEIRSITLQ